MLRMIAQRALILLGASTLLSVGPWILSGGLTTSLARGGDTRPPLPLPHIPDGLTVGPVHLGGPLGTTVGALLALALWPVRLVADRVLWLVAHVPLLGPALVLLAAAAAGIVATRARARARRRYVRLRVTPYRTDDAGPSDVVSMMEALQHQLIERWWRRVLHGQPSVALEVLFRRRPDANAGGVHEASLAVSCPEPLERGVRAAIAGC